MATDEPQNCWEFQKCSKETREKCPAYTLNSGKECWLIATHYCPKIKREFEYCGECPWFNKLNPDFNEKHVLGKKVNEI